MTMQYGCGRGCLSIQVAALDHSKKSDIIISFDKLSQNDFAIAF